MGMDGADDLPDWVRPRVRMRPWEEVRHRYEGPPGRSFEGWRGQVKQHEEQVEARIGESKQRDRGLLEDNRAACGLLPLTPEQISEWGLEGTAREEWDDG